MKKKDTVKEKDTVIEKDTAKEKNTVKEKGKSKKKIIGIIILFLVLVGIISGIYLYYRNTNKETEGFSQRQGGRNGINFSGNMVSAYGVTSIGVVSSIFEVENTTTTLEVEEIFVNSGEEVEEGSPIFRVNLEQVEALRKELTASLKSADLAYRAGVIAYEQSLITAEYDKDIALLEGENAEEIYQETIANLENEVNKALEEFEDAKEQIAEYEEGIANTSYYTEYEVEKYKKIYDENLSLLTETMDANGIGWEQITSGGNMQGQGGNSMVSTLVSLYSVLETNRKDYDQALEAYEEMMENISFYLQTLQLQLSGLEKTYETAKESHATSLLQAKLTKETSLANASQATKTYEATITKAASDLENLKEAYEDAESNLTVFEESIGDGYFYASRSGTLQRMMVRVGNTITASSNLFTYTDPSSISVTVSVDQADISKLSVADRATIQSTSGTSYQAEIAAIEPISSSTSRTSITYNVTLKILDETEALTANETVTVIFGMGERN